MSRVANAFVKDIAAYFIEAGAIKHDEIAFVGSLRRKSSRDRVTKSYGSATLKEMFSRRLA
jgi:hypothetical protein